MNFKKYKIVILMVVLICSLMSSVFAKDYNMNNANIYDDITFKTADKDINFTTSLGIGNGSSDWMIFDTDKTRSYKRFGVTAEATGGDVEEASFYVNATATDPTQDIAQFMVEDTMKFVIEESGDVGIGIANPTATLHVSAPSAATPADSLIISGGDGTAGGAGKGADISLTAGTGGTHSTTGGDGGDISITAGVGGAATSTGGEGGDLILSAGDGGVAMGAYGGDVYIDSGEPYGAGTAGDIILQTQQTSKGNVGIGDTTPTYKLDVNGTGRYTGILTADSNLVVDTDTLYVDASDDCVGINNTGTTTDALAVYSSVATQDGIYVYKNAQSNGDTTNGAYASKNYFYHKPDAFELNGPIEQYANYNYYYGDTKEDPGIIGGTDDTNLFASYNKINLTDIEIDGDGQAIAVYGLAETNDSSYTLTNTGNVIGVMGVADQNNSSTATDKLTVGLVGFGHGGYSNLGIYTSLYETEGSRTYPVNGDDYAAFFDGDVASAHTTWIDRGVEYVVVTNSTNVTFESSGQRVIMGNTSGAILIPFPTMQPGSIVTQIRIKSKGEDGEFDQLDYTVYKDDGNGTAASATSVATDTIEGTGGIVVTTVNITDITYVEGYRYWIHFSPSLSSTASYVYSAGFEFSQRNY